MKKKSSLLSAFFNPRIAIALFLITSGGFLALLGSGLFAAAEEPVAAQAPQATEENSGIQFGQDYHRDVSPPLSDLPAIWPPKFSNESAAERTREANLNPKLPLPLHVDGPDPVIDHGVLDLLAPTAMPATTLSFDGIPYPGVGCNCAPPDTVGEVGATQYVQMVNNGYQVFNKTTGASVLGPLAISSIWSGFGGVCQSNGRGDPVVLYDQLANRWVITQFAGTSVPTDECIAISTTSNATGSYFRYAFHLGTNFFDYPHLGVWPDGYYMTMHVFNSAGTAYLGPQAFAFNRTAMLTGAAATFVTPGITVGPTEPSFLPADLDGSILPTAGVGNPFVSFPGTGTYKVRLFHADFTTPANTTFNQIGAPAAAAFTTLCGTTRNCIPQAGTTSRIDGIGDRLMFRTAYRKFADGHEAIVGNYSVSAGGVSGVRWFELRAVTTAPVVFQQSTYQPDTTWRWMGSAAMDNNGNLAVGFSASSASISPQIRYAGRLAGDTINTLAQGEATLFSGSGSQTNLNRWGDYSAMTVDPVDDCTFWYTQEYLPANGSFNWRTRIGSFKFPSCVSGPTPSPTASPAPTASPSPTRTPSPTPTPAPTPTPTPGPTPLSVTVSLPVASVNTATTNFSQPITCTNINAGDNLIGFQGDFTFNETVVTFQSPPVSAAGLTSNNWNVAANVLPGGGPTRTLRISAFSNDGVTPLSGAGTLLLLNMTRVSSTPGANTALTWLAFPNDFEFINTDIEIRIPNNTPVGSITIVAGATATPTAAPTSTPTPPAVISISGTATYCSNPSLNPVPGVTMTLSGGASGTTATNASGNYTFAGLASGGNYTVTPAKAALPAASTGINTQDVLGVQRHFLGITIIPAGCRLTAADTNGDAAVNTIDVVAVQRFFLGFTTGIANVGKYSFSPVNRTYTAVVSNQTGQNYDVLVFGDVATGFVHRPSGPSQDATDGDFVLPPTVAIVSLPEVAVDRLKTNNVAKVMSSVIDSANRLVGFQGDFTFDERVVTFGQNPVQKAGLTIGNWNVSGNVLPGVGPMRTLRISAYSTDFKPLSGEGTLFELNMRQVRKTGQSTPLIWATAPNGFVFIDADLNLQKPGTAPAGSIAVKR